MLRNATLDFEAGARVEIDSLFENCSIKLGEGTELVVGESGVLADCNDRRAAASSPCTATSSSARAPASWARASWW